jgi:hypothetical protein
MSQTNPEKLRQLVRWARAFPDKPINYHDVAVIEEAILELEVWHLFDPERAKRIRENLTGSGLREMEIALTYPGGKE